MALEPTIRDQGFQNWLKSALALVFAKQGLEEFVTVELTEFQKDLLTSICKKQAISPDTVCNLCTTENILSCPTANFCPGRRKCDLHDFVLPNKTPRNTCPKTICHHLRDGIRRQHWYNNPSWKNTDATGWCDDSFQIAKCYMPPDGYSSVHTFADTDFNGMISIIINNRHFVEKFDAKLDEKNNVCSEARDVGRSVRHASDMSISDEDLSKTIEILTDLLSDARYLANDTKAKQAVEKLKQLEANTLTISTSDITTILDEEFKVLVARQQENALKAISTEREEVQKKMLDDVKNAFANMQTVTLHHLDQIVATKMSEIQQVAEKEKKELTEISAKGKQQIEEEIRKGKGVALSEEGTETNTKQRELEKCKKNFQTSKSENPAKLSLNNLLLS